MSPPFLGENLKKFETKFAEAQKLLIPEDELNDYLDALERLRFSIDKVNDTLDIIAVRDWEGETLLQFRKIWTNLELFRHSSV